MDTGKGHNDDPSRDVLAEGVTDRQPAGDLADDANFDFRAAERVPPSAADLDEGREGSASTGGHFFAVDSGVWPEICSMGMNPAIAYLVLGRGTGRDLVTTTWSVNAIETYTGISRVRAREAVTALIKHGLISVAGGTKTHPRYLLHTAIDRAPPPPPGRRRMESEAPSPAWIWLPNALVTGAAEEIPPVELVRQTRDVMMLRLLVELYGDQHLRADGGVRRDVVCRIYKRHDLGPAAQFTVWGFSDPQRYTEWSGAAACHHISGPDPTRDFFSRLESLETVGLIEFVPHLVEGLDPDAEIVHPYGLGNSDSLEDRLGAAASDAAYALLTEQSQQWATRFHVAPVPRHIKNVQMIEIVRLRYRAQTRAAAAWQANLHETGARHLDVYGRIGAARTDPTADATSTGRSTETSTDVFNDLFNGLFKGLLNGTTSTVPR